MTVTSDSAAVEQVEMISCTIDGFEIEVPKGTLIIRAAELLGIQIPRFCDHPLLDPVGACRQCLVEIPDAGNGRGMPKPQASCTTTVMPGMVVKTQLTSPVADKAQHGVMELLLINHPLDCPICDKGGECPLQNQAMSNGRGETRFVEAKRTFPKPLALSSQVLLDRERCIQCARCTRFSDQIAGDAFIDLFERGAKEQVGTADGKPFQSYFSGNTVQICPVGALTGAAYRFRSRPFDLVSQPSTCEHCASGCALRTDHRRGKITRRLAGDDPQVNEEWNCDKGRWAFTYATRPDRLTHPLVRNEAGELEVASWPEALSVAARGLAAARGSAGVLTGGRVTLEDAYAYAKFARIALGTNDVDFRARPMSDEESRFLGSSVAGRPIEVTYADLEKAPAVLLAGFEPEEESPIVFLRLRKAFRKKALKVFSAAPFATRGLRKVGGTLLPTQPGAEAETLGSLIGEGGHAGVRALLEAPGAVILVGERLAGSPGALSAVVRLAQVTGARLAWVPRRAGERGAVEAGALPGLLPIGRPVADPRARAEVARAWGVAELPAEPGLGTDAIIAAAAQGRRGALLVGGVDPEDLPDPRAVLAALEATPFVVSLEQRPSAVTDRADVVLPVAAVAEKSGTFVDWEGRGRQFDVVLRSAGRMSDLRVLNTLADEMDVHLGLPGPDAARRELSALGAHRGERPDAPNVPQAIAPHPERGEALLATWRLLLDRGRLQDGEPFLAGTAKPAAARLSPATAAEIGADGAVRVSGPRGEVTLPLEITGDLPDRVVWLPTNSAGCALYRDLGAVAGGVVRVAGASGGTLTGAAPRGGAIAARDVPGGVADGPADEPAGGSR
ncbi:NADH-quinone oxidoreductase subunit G [Actinomadura sp. NEAU-AAG7]|uniref:NADH-quinone oxidoreductase subunit G n=1 Tax=Actinomadura sp. NEAU-AAG7 TaxID=2839640 RepID=UPI001BE4A312|nr:NADH-quinone oxidoreductase subunit G [Actinomadura sp. NEAU-AAG7]MBT2210265.1 NADH-quinone oxidoreductase subunit G [Actinomadura sp. NEAU-AAG7]